VFRIEWDHNQVKRAAERKAERIRVSGPSYPGCFEISSLFRVLVNDVDISGLTERQNPRSSGTADIFLGTFSVFRSIDPERLGHQPFQLYYNVKNCVLGDEFRYYVHYDRKTDLVAITYIYLGEKVFRTLQLPLREYADGVIRAADVMIVEILAVSPACRDDSYHRFTTDLEIIKTWYHEKYGEDADDSRRSAESSRVTYEPGVVTTEYPGAVQIVWNGKEVEEGTRMDSYTSDPSLALFEMSFHLFIDDVNVTFGGSTFYDFFFNQLIICLHRVIEEISPGFPQIKEKIDQSTFTRVSGPAWGFYLIPAEDDLVIIDFMWISPSNRARVTVPLKKLIRAVVQGNEEFLREIVGIRPELSASKLYKRQTADNAILRKWYRERYHEELPYSPGQ